MMTKDAKVATMNNGYGPTGRTFMNGPDSVKALSGSKMSLQSLRSNASSNSSKALSNGHSTHTLAAFEEKVISLNMETNDRRFGFSVYGGIDQDQPPKVNKISLSSPAARSGLQLNDEIIELNGITVDHMTHAEIIMHIHKCKINITLKIRRYATTNGYENGDIHEMGVDILRPAYTAKEFNGINMEPQQQLVVQPKLEKYNNRESNVPAKYYNEAFELDPDDRFRDSTIPSRFVNEGFEREDDFVDVTPSRRVDLGPNQPKSLSLDKFINILDEIGQKLNGSSYQDDIFHLHHLFSSPNFQSAVRTHNNMTKFQVAKRNMEIFKPVSFNSQIEDVCLVIQDMNDPVALDLLHLINTPEMQGLLMAHDRIAQREEDYMDSDSDNPDGMYPEDSINGDEDETHYKIVRIDKSNDPLGATVRNEGDAVIISRIIKGGAAEKSGVLNEGDEILEINDESVKGKNVNEVVELLAELEGTLTFVLLPSIVPHKETLNEDTIVMKALFDYDPKHDDMLPCEELGLGFRKGDVLEILNQNDPDWWQARPMNNENRPLAGLIPSKPYQLQREAAKITLKGEDSEPILKEKKLCLCGRGRRKGKKEGGKKRNPPLKENEVLTYEDMVKRYPDPARKRPIVLIGPDCVGRKELRKRLIREFPDRYAAPVSHTSRLPTQDELSGVDYTFVTRAVFEKSIAAAEFIDHGQSGGHYYGTSFKAVRDVISNGKTCILHIKHTALTILKSSYLLPYVIFITLPTINTIKQLREDSTCEPFNPAIQLKDGNIDEMIEQARSMSNSHGHYFDKVIVNHNFDETYKKLLETCTSLERDAQWVPASWLPGG